MYNPKDIILLDSVEEAWTLSYLPKECFIPNPQGYYMTNNPIPVFVDGQEYYTDRDYYELNGALKDLEGNIDDSIRNKNGDIVIPKYIIRNKNKLLKRHSEYSYSANIFVYKYILEYFDTICPYASKKEKEVYYSDCLTEYGMSILYTSDFKPEIYLRKMLEELDVFVGEDIWNIYNVKVSSRNIYIEKMEDFRILDWIRIKEEEAMKAKDEEEYRRNVY